MSSKKPFKDTTVGQLLFGAASVINPTLGNVLQGVTSPKEALAEITKSNISSDDKIKLQQMIFDQQNKEMDSVTARWKADMNSVNSGWLSKNVRPLVLIWCIVVFSLAGILDSVTSINFQINSLWNDTFEKVMLAVVFSFFGGRTFEKGANIITGNKK
tara:strand:- start:1171 stop:1644 length:474 start_codon:yes stop_codon:yes gene_type:complete